MIKDNGLKAVQIIWEETKANLERNSRSFLSNLERTDPNTARIIKEKKDEMIETIERDLYPDRKKNKGSSNWIWLLAIVGIIIIVGIISSFRHQKPKKKKVSG